MAANRANTATIIVKRRKGGGEEGHHGGAWKVAYADFVTAMMAFFLLMWLLNATTEDQRKGIADYFDPTVPISRVSAGGADMFRGESLLASEQLAQAKVPHSLGRGKAGERTPNDRAAATEGDASGTKTSIEAVLNQQLSAQGEDISLLQHLKIRLTDEGVTIDIADTEGNPMFRQGRTEPTERMRLIVEAVGGALAAFGNDVAITGHTDAVPFALAGGYSNWELSSDRGHAARRMLEAAGVEAGRIQRVVGVADRQPIADSPFAPSNRRISVTLLR